MALSFGKETFSSHVKDKKFLLGLTFSFVILSIFLINTLHESYPDEFDNILGGWYLLHGKLIYSDWFSHHGPVPYFVAALVEIFGGRSFVGFRFFYALFLFFLTFGSFLFVKRSLKLKDSSIYLFFIFILSISTTYFWGHMLLADSLAAFFLLPVFVLIFLKTFYNEPMSFQDYIFISAFSSLVLLSSLAYIYLVAGIYVFMLIREWLERRENFLKRIIKICIIFGAPFLVFLVYLLLTRSIDDYIYQAIVFNRKFYIYYPGFEGTLPSNPLRFAIIIAQGFHNNFSSLLLGVKDFNFVFPFNIALGVANTAAFIYLLFKRRFLLAVLLLGVLIFSNVRTNPWDSRETDYQSAVYIMLSLFNMVFIIKKLYEELNTNLDYGKKLVFSALFLLVGVYAFFNITYLFRKFSYKTYNKYMGYEATIYDRPQVAPMVNSITSENDYAWIGPFAYEDLYYKNAKNPSKYQVLLPGMGSSPQIQEEILEEFSKNKPKVIYFDKSYFILGKSPETYGKFFLSFLDKNYTTLDEEFIYKSKIPISTKLDIETKLYIDKDRENEVIGELLSNNLIEER